MRPIAIDCPIFAIHLKTVNNLIMACYSFPCLPSSRLAALPILFLALPLFPVSLPLTPFPCHTSENSPLSPTIATLPKWRVSNPCVCHTSETPWGSFQFAFPRFPRPLLCPHPKSRLPNFTFPYSLSFHETLFRNSRTYLQEPAPRRPGGIQPCPTKPGLSSPRLLSLLPQFFSFRRSAPWRNPARLQQVLTNQPLPSPRIAGCTSASSARTPKARPSRSTCPSNSPKKFFPPSTRNASTTARSKSTTPTSMTSTSAPSSKPSAPPRTVNSSPCRAMIATCASPNWTTT